MSNPCVRCGRRNNLLGQQCYRSLIFQQNDSPPLSPSHPPAPVHRTSLMVFQGAADGGREQECNMAGARQPDSPRPRPGRSLRLAIDKTEKSSVIGEILNRRFLGVSGAFKSLAPISEKSSLTLRRIAREPPNLRKSYRDRSCDSESDSITFHVYLPTLY